MKPNSLIVILLFFACFYISSAKEAPFIHKCKAEDSKCILQSTQVAIPILAAGIPSLGVDTLDPLIIDKIDANSPNLKLILTHATVKGLKDCVPKKVRRDVVKSKIYIKAECSIEVNGHYEMSRQLLLLSLSGHGKFKVILRKGVISSSCDLEKIKKTDGKIYWHMRDWKYSFELHDKASVVFENLFGGNEVLARATQEVIDSNSNEIVLEIGKPIIDVLMGKAMASINQFYDAVPEENLAID